MTGQVARLLNMPGAQEDLHFQISAPVSLGQWGVKSKAFQMLGRGFMCVVGKEKNCLNCAHMFLSVVGRVIS